MQVARVQLQEAPVERQAPTGMGCLDELVTGQIDTMQGEFLILGVEEPETARELDICGNLGPELHLGAIDPRPGRVRGAQAGPLAAGQRKGVEELLVAVAVMKDREIKGGSPLPELQLGADLVRIELLRLGEGELCRRIEGLSVEGCSAVPLGEACVEQRLIVWLPVDAHFTAGVVVVVLERRIDAARRTIEARVLCVGTPGNVRNRLSPQRRAGTGPIPRRGRVESALQRVEVGDFDLVFGVPQAGSNADRGRYCEGRIQERGTAVFQLIEIVPFIEAIECLPTGRHE